MLYFNSAYKPDREQKSFAVGVPNKRSDDGQQFYYDK